MYYYFVIGFFSAFGESIMKIYTFFFQVANLAQEAQPLKAG